MRAREEPDPDPFPVIIGSGRSGTTLLRSMLDAHDRFAIVQEGRFLVHASRQRGRYERRDGFAVERFVDDLYSWPKSLSRINELAMEPSAVLDALRTAEPRTTADAIRVTYGVYAQQHGKPIAGDKAPGYLLYLEHLGRCFPETRFIHIVRDGRDVALAYLSAPFGPDSVPAAALDWAFHVRMARRVGQRLGASRYLEVSYEELVSAPEPVLTRVCSFLDASFSPSMLDYNSPSRLDSLLTAQPHLASLRKPLTTGLRDWREQMSTRDQILFEALAGTALTEFGYDTLHADRTGSVAQRDLLRYRLAFRWFLAYRAVRVRGRTLLTRLR